MHKHIFSGGNGAIAQVANGRTFDPAMPLKLKKGANRASLGTAKTAKPS